MRSRGSSGRPGFSIAVALATVVSLSSDAVAASGQWSGVGELKRFTQVRVTLPDGRVVSGQIFAATDNTVTVGGTVIARDQVTLVEVRGAGHRWWSVPVIVAVTAAGVAASVGVAKAMGQNGLCRTPSEECSAVSGFVVALPTLAAAGGSFIGTRRAWWVVVYRAPGGRATAAGGPPLDAEAVPWEVLRRALPPSLRGRR